MPDHPDLGGYVLGVLEPAEAGAFEDHLTGCADCRREVADLAPLPALLAAAAAPVGVPAGLRWRALAAVERQAVAAPTADPAPTAAAVRKTRPARRRLVAAAAAAAAVVMALGFGLGRHDGAAGPAPFVVALRAPAGGPAAGRATIRNTPVGKQVDLEVSGLPQGPPGSYYECWYTGAGDSPEHPNRISAGTFRVDGRGKARVRMVTAADRQHFPGVDLTLEPADGDPQRTGPTVLVSG